MLTLASARLIGYTGTRHHRLAAAVEFIHTATLLHDDVVDGSDLRRGKRTANIIWGNPASVLVGDFLFSRSVRADGRGRQPQGAQDPVERQRGDRGGRGQPADRRTPRRSRRGPLSRHHRRQDRRAVRRRLPHRRGGRRAAARARKRRSTPMAAISASPSSWSTTRSTMSSDAGTMGKDAGDDFREGKMTLPVILAYARGGADDRKFWKDAIEGRRASRRGFRARDRSGPPDPRGRRHARARAPLRPARDRRARRLRATARPRTRWSRRSSSRWRGPTEGKGRSPFRSSPRRRG